MRRRPSSACAASSLSKGRKRRPRARPVSLLVAPLLALLSASARATLPTVPQSECAPQFKVNGFLVSGCTTRDTPAAGLPYCVLATPRQGSNLGLCQIESMRQRFVQTPGGAQAQCDTWTSLPQQGLVYGCFINDSTLSGQLVCNAGQQGLQPCLKLTTDGTIQPEMAIASGESSPKREISPTLIALISSGAGLLLLILALSTFCIVRRRRRSKLEVYAVTGLLDPALSTSAKKGSRKTDEKTQRKAEEKSKKESRTEDVKRGEAGGRGGAARNNPRVSSQYTVDSALSGDEADSPTNDPQLPLGTFVIKSSYTPTLADEIMVYPGDTVKVYQEFDDGWCSAVNLSRGFTRGVIPVNCIDPTSGQADE